jgi:glycosyltransferase involved in cell wall biosynthesis
VSDVPACTGAKRTLVIIPALNEEESLPRVLSDLAAQLPEFDVLVVDDGSRDGTAAVAARCGVSVLSLPFNLGVGGALQTGFRYAVRHDYDRAIQFDADGQHDPSEVWKLIAGLDAGADLMIGSRFAAGGAVTYPVGPTRRLGMKILRRIVRALVGRDFTDTTSGFRAFSRPMLDYFAVTYPTEYMGDTVEALVLASNQGFHPDEVGVNMHGRTGGAPSNRRFRLFYYYVRLVVVLLSSASRRSTRDAFREARR